MSFRTFFGKLFLTKNDRQTLEQDLQHVRQYTDAVLEEERQIAERKRLEEAGAAARKAEEKRREQERRKKESSSRPPVESGGKYSLATPPYIDDEIYPDEALAPMFSLSMEDSDLPAIDEFGYNSPYGIEDILSNPEAGRTIRRDLTFAEKLRQLMAKYSLVPSAVYKAGNVDKSLFSKILSNNYYSPSRDTALSIAFGMKLSLEEAEDLIGRAGYTLSHSIVRDIVLECCFKKRIYNVVEINIILEKLGHKPLSRL